MPGGRPSVYKDEYCQQLIEFMKDGKGVPAFCAKIGIHQDTFYDWCKKKPEFSEAYKEAKCHAQAWYEQQALDNLDNKQFNSTLWIMFMRNKFGWNSRDEITHKLDSGETKDKRLVIDLSGNDYKKLDDKE